jgi:hypothetical protein
MMRRLRVAFGAFRILRERAIEGARPGLAVWTDTGAAALKQVSAVVMQVDAQAHKAELGVREIEAQLREILKDGRVDDAELAVLQLAPARLHRVADECHDIGEALTR